MRFTRRQLGQTSLALTASAASPALGAATFDSRAPNADTYTLRIGDIRVTVISDGQIGFPAWPTYAPDATEGEVTGAMRQHFLTPPDYRLDANALLVETGGRRVLIDTGWGAFAPQVGQLAERLQAIGVAPSSIDLVFISHIHPDHVGGLTEDGGAPTYPAAEIALAETEFEQWRGEADFGAMRIDESFRPLFAAAAEMVIGLGDRLRLVKDGDDIAPGLSTVSLPGHTRGHCGLQIESGAETLLYVADAFHDQAFDLDHPGWATVFDSDPAGAEATRRGLLDRAAADRAMLMAYHMPFPGIGHVAASGGGFNWTPARWVVAP
ncbi:MAG: MBL fold metallo-hydrolase [Pseudomonadota bacterium]